MVKAKVYEAFCQTCTDSFDHEDEDECHIWADNHAIVCENHRIFIQPLIV